MSEVRDSRQMAQSFLVGDSVGVGGGVGVTGTTPLMKNSSRVGGDWRWGGVVVVIDCVGSVEGGVVAMVYCDESGSCGREKES